MAETTIETCYHCELETDCIVDTNGKWICSECYDRFF